MVGRAARPAGSRRSGRLEGGGPKSGGPRSGGRLLFVLAAVFVFTSHAFAANQLTASPRKVTLDDTVEINLVLENSFAEIGDVQLPVRNLRIAGAPSTSTQFEWINGKTSRRSVRTYTATPVAVGGALVGPLVLRDDRGRQIVLPAVTLDVVESAAGTGSPGAVAAQIDESGKEKLFILAEADRTKVYAGEQAVVTWYLYTAVPVRDFGITQAPSLQDFWVEELTVNGIQPQTVSVNGHEYKRFAVRRVALFPLRSGKLGVGALEGVAEIVEPTVDVFGQSLFEGRVANARRRSQALAVEAQPLPDGPPPDAIGEFSMSCSTPNVPQSGPVAVNVTVSGRGNLRAAVAPRFASPIDADVDAQEGTVKVDRAADWVAMTRSWRILIFPRRSGQLSVPPLVFDEFNPVTGARMRLSCGGARLSVAAAKRQATSPQTPLPPPSPASAVRPYLLPSILGAVAVAGLAFFARRMWRGRKPVDRAAYDRIVATVDPREKRRALFETVAERGIDPKALMNERTELGDRFRAVISWIDIAQRESMTGDVSPHELEARVRELLGELARR